MSTDVRPGQFNPGQCHACGYHAAGALRICPKCGVNRKRPEEPQPLPRSATGDMGQTLDHLNDEEDEG
jgi:hypothetical protein